MNNTPEADDLLFADFTNSALDYMDYDFEKSGPKKKSKLDIFLTLNNADTKNKDFLSNLPEDQRADFTPMIVMRWFSAVNDSSKYKDYFITVTNEFLNIDFWALSDHPELQWKLLAACGPGVSIRHNWIPLPKRAKVSKTGVFLLNWYPGANDLELRILINSMDQHEFEQFVKSTGATDAELRETVENFNVERGFVTEKTPKKQGKKQTKI